MTVTVNGEKTIFPEWAAVSDAVMEARGSTDGRGFAVAVNGEVVPRGEWSRKLADGDKVEVLTAVAGG